jgi:cellulose synthase/poly-beta-1,6-N-acetylglucosamine synthase-like glycosyltransferase
VVEAYLAVLGASGAVTILLVVALRWGLGRHGHGDDSAGRPTVSVVIAARNEARNIDACLAHLARQDYPPELTQVAVVDDASEDDTADRAESWTNRVPNLRVIRSQSLRYRCRKKSAVDRGIRETTGDVILTTDADCRPPPTWISAMADRFGPGAGVVIGHAPLVPGPGVVQALLALQAVVVSALSAGSAGLGLPLTCTGRNLAYRREAFEKVGGFDAIGHIVGGDDVLLMRLIARRTSFAVRYQPDPKAHVPSDVHGSGLFARQVRYQSKAVHAGPFVLILAFCVYIFHLALAAGPLVACVRPDVWQPLGLLLLLKAVADGAFLRRAGRLLQDRFRLVWVPALALISVPYVVLFFALGALGASRWK